MAHPQPRNKFSPPPPAIPTDGDRAILAGFAFSSGYALLLDELHRYAIEQEIEVYVGDLSDPTATLERIHQARAAWLVMDRIQQRVRAAAEEREERRSQTVTNSREDSINVSQVLGTE